jgi:hypothetical protein
MTKRNKLQDIILQTINKSGDKSSMRKGTGSVDVKWNISVVLCDTYIP